MENNTNNLFLEFKDFGEDNPTPYNKETFNELQTKIKQYIDNLNKSPAISESALDLTNGRCGEPNANKLRKQLDLVILDFEAYATNFQTGYNLVGKIPTGYMPAQSGYYEGVLLYFPVMLSGMNKIAFGRITSSGNIEVYSDGNSAHTIGYVSTDIHIRIHTSWFVGGDSDATN